MSKYVEDVIKDDYKKWLGNLIVFIEAPTGSGKTTFILDKLVDFAASEGKRILYLVNRDILKKQLDKKIDNLKIELCKPNDNEFNENLNKAIEVKLYQSIEAECRANPQIIKSDTCEYQYIVADECHYFLTDSVFNTYTQFSYEWIMAKIGYTNLIFISATIERIKTWITERMNVKKIVSLDEVGGLRNVCGKSVAFVGINIYVIEYLLENDYSFVVPKVLNSMQEIEVVIENEGGGKWLIFIDSIKEGEEIVKSLKKSGIDALFIDSFLKDHDYNVQRTVKEISKIESFSEQVLVATAVLDNGVSINDMEVRNLIIKTDTREEFIQMLGRKRRLNNEKILNVYILKRSEGYFSQRLKNIQGQLEFMIKHDSVNLEEIMESDMNYFFAKRAYYLLWDSLRLNEFAFEQFRYLHKNYKKIIERFKNEDSYAFVREQLEWLGKEREYINKMTQSQTDRLIKRVSDVIEDYINKGDLTEEENIDLRDSIKEDLKELIEIKLNEKKDEKLEKDFKNDIKELGQPGRGKKDPSKNHRPLTCERFHKIAGLIELKYKMLPPTEKEKEGHEFYCRISKIENES